MSFVSTVLSFTNLLCQRSKLKTTHTFFSNKLRPPTLFANKNHICYSHLNIQAPIGTRYSVSCFQTRKICLFPSMHALQTYSLQLFITLCCQSAQLVSYILGECNSIHAIEQIGICARIYVERIRSPPESHKQELRNLILFITCAFKLSCGSIFVEDKNFPMVSNTSRISACQIPQSTLYFLFLEENFWDGIYSY